MGRMPLKRVIAPHSGPFWAPSLEAGFGPIRHRIRHTEERVLASLRGFLPFHGPVKLQKTYVQNPGCEHRDFAASGYTSPHPSSPHTSSAASVLTPHPSSEQGFLKLKATETY